jgi:hypothetical protein
MALGGGHAANTQWNGVARFNVNTLKWELVQEASAFVKDPLILQYGNAHYPDGRPAARHTWNDLQIVEHPTRGPMIRSQRGIAVNFAEDHTGGNPDYLTTKADLLFLDTLSWHHVTPYLSPENRMLMSAPSGIDPRTQKIYHTDLDGRVLELDPMANVVDGIPMGAWSYKTASGTADTFGKPYLSIAPGWVDPVNNRWVVGRSNVAVDQITMYTIGVGASRFRITGPGAPVVNQSWRRYLEDGGTYDPVNNRYLMYTYGGGHCVAMDPITGYTQILFSGLPFANGGVQDRFQYVPQLGGVLFMPTFNDDMIYIPVADYA